MNKQEWLHQFKRELKLRNYADNTIDVYAGCLNIFLSNYAAYNGYKSVEDIKSFLLTFHNQNYHKQFVATIHHFYGYVVKKPISLDDIPYPRKTHYLPQVLSIQEVHRLLSTVQNLKHKTILQLMYACALRIGELPAIELSHLDFDNRTILIKGAKGFKDRYVPVPADTVTLLKSYILAFKPKKKLLEGWSGQTYSVRSIQQIFGKAIKEAGILKRVTPHCIRHSRITHLHDAGVDIKHLKELAGHNSLKTTEIYTHISQKALAYHMALADKILQETLTKNILIY